MPPRSAKRTKSLPDYIILLEYLTQSIPSRTRRPLLIPGPIVPTPCSRCFWLPTKGRRRIGSITRKFRCWCSGCRGRGSINIWRSRHNVNVSSRGGGIVRSAVASGIRACCVRGWRPGFRVGRWRGTVIRRSTRVCSVRRGLGTSEWISTIWGSCTWIPSWSSLCKKLIVSMLFRVKNLKSERKA